MFRLRKYFDYTPSPITDGTLSIVAVGGSASTATNKYTFADSSVVTAGALTIGGAEVACGNANIGLFMAAGNTTSGSLYAYASNTRTGRTLSATVYQSMATSNDTTGIICRGGASPGTALTLKYTYVGDTMVPGTNLLANAFRGGAVGTLTFALIGLGNSSAATNTYTYAGDAVASATALSTTIFNAAAAGNGTEGVFAIGSATNTTRYIYASNTSSAGGSLQSAGSGLGGNWASGIGSTGLFNATSTNAPSRYDYTSDTTTAGTAFLQTQGRASLANGTQGVTL